MIIEVNIFYTNTRTCGSFLFKVLWPEKQQTLSFWVGRHLENCQPRQPFLHLPMLLVCVASWQVSAETWAWVGCKGPTVQFPQADMVPAPQWPLSLLAVVALIVWVPLTH